jgi:hypothetical protein
MPTITRVQVEGELQWRFWKAKEGPFMAVCDALKLALESDSWSELLEDMALAIDALLKEMLATDELDRFLRDHGWTLAEPLSNRLADVQFEIPFEVIAAQRAKHDQQECVH